MSLPGLKAEDLAELEGAFPGLDFADDERREALLEMSQRDLHAAPGSGKTTLLAAKLFLLSKKWEHARRGVCVLSHTNVAGEEISKRLLQSAEGSRLLAYPHFIGTIQTFVDRFLALPRLRSIGVPVEIIDNETFARRALSAARRVPTLWGWLDRQPNAANPAIAGLCYRGATLELASADGDLPSATSKSYQELVTLKQRLASAGVHRFDDMFAYAEVLLAATPTLKDRLSHRFPLVLVDEMQDTSWVQEEFISRLFDDTVVLQRFGDVNQRIHSSPADAARLTFPRADCLNISSSKRFPSNIASIATAVQLKGAPIVGQSSAVPMAPRLLLYATDAIEQVIPRFGHIVLDSFSHEELALGAVKAVCTRKQGDAKQPPGRHLGDYWSPYLSASAGTPGRQDLAWVILADQKNSLEVAFTLAARAKAARKVVMLALRQAKSDFGAAIRDESRLLWALEQEGVDTRELRRVIRDLAVARGLNGSAASWDQMKAALFAALQPLLPLTMSPATFSAMALFEIPEDAGVLGFDSHSCIVERAGRQVRVQIGTVASVKGETHLATLLLESHGGQSKKFDLEMALSNLCGQTPVSTGWSALVQGQYRNMYVAMSRPSRLLCLAMNSARADAAHVAAMKTQGWLVEEIVRT